MKDKTLAVYEAPHDPTRKGVTHVALRIDITSSLIPAPKGAGLLRRWDPACASNTWLNVVSGACKMNPAYVSGAYMQGEEIPQPSDDELVLPIKEANRMFFYRRGRAEGDRVILE